MEGVGADVADRGLQRIGLLRVALAARSVGARRAAAGAEAAVRADAARPWTKRWSKVCCSGLGIAARIEVVVARRRSSPPSAGAARSRRRRIEAAPRRARAPCGRCRSLRLRDRSAAVAAAVARPPRSSRRLAPRVAALRRSRSGASLLAAGEAADRAHVVLVEIDPDAALQAVRQHHRAVADADQPAHRQADRVEQLAHLAIAAFGDDDAVPVVGAFAAAVLDRLERCALAVDRRRRRAASRASSSLERAQHAHRVLALDAEARMHQLVGQLARVREQQQAFGVDVEPADRLPLALLQARQAAEHGRPVLRIVVRDDLAGRLVVRDDRAPAAARCAARTGLPLTLTGRRTRCAGRCAPARR